MTGVEVELCNAAWDGNVFEVRRLTQETRDESSAVQDVRTTATVAQSTSYYAPLLLACRNDRVPVVRYLVEEIKAKVEGSAEPYSRQPLHWACYEGYTDIAKILVEKGGANVNLATTEGGWTPLHYACINNSEDDRRVDLANYLVQERNANVAATNNQGHTPLHTACLLRNLSMVRYLAQVTPKMDSTVLTLAFNKNLPRDILRMLLVQYSRSNNNKNNDEFDNDKEPDLHTVLKYPPPTSCVPSTYLEQCFDGIEFSSLDDFGRLALHVGLLGPKRRHSAFVFTKLVEMEPRAASLRDPGTGFFPFQQVSTYATVSENQHHDEENDSLTSQVDESRTNNNRMGTKEQAEGAKNASTPSVVVAEDDESQWLDIIYRLFRNYDPDKLLR